MEISQSLETRKSSLCKRSSTQYLVCIARFVIPMVMVIDTILRAVMMKRLLLHSMLNVKRMVARKMCGSNRMDIELLLK